MKIVTTTAQLTEEIKSAKSSGNVGFVPTMGALHDGHVSLVSRCRKENDIVVVSVFVNPTQFNDSNDLANYPRCADKDAQILEGAGCDILFLPSVEEVYPEKDTRVFNFGELEAVMEGPLRPGHFNGVAQVVSRLFSLVEPNRAYFGEKDFQQLAIIRKMVSDLAINIEIVGCEIVRAADGLALSSRNQLLSESDREKAPLIYMTISRAVKVAETLGCEYTKKWVKEQIESVEPMKLDYFEIVDAATLQNIEKTDKERPSRGCIAVKLGDIRLIDNIAF